MASLHIANEFRNLIFLITHPVGSYYISENGTSPAQTYGGSWQKISGYYLYADSSVSTTNYTGKNTQGHTLTANQSGLRSHAHNYTTGRWFYAERDGGGDIICNQSGTSYNFIRETTYTGGWDAAESHSHNIATKGVIVYKRIG